MDEEKRKELRRLMADGKYDSVEEILLNLPIGEALAAAVLLGREWHWSLRPEALAKKLEEK